ncbi:MAG TPA: GNAT family N-acetyltransferase [Angustibacter sp.]|nr:GNAT family N-acetyltransferase [Angustibacter sp.]
MSHDLLRIETFYDAVPRPVATPHEVGPLRLFVRDGAGWPFYARPSEPSVTVRADDVHAVLRRQDELGVPQAFEWVHELTPSLTAAAQEAGLAVQRCPLLVLDVDALAQVPDDVAAPAGVHVAVAAPDDPDLGIAEAVASVAFGARIGTAVGDAGPAERDAAASAADPASLTTLRDAMRDGRQARVVARTGEGPVGVGGMQTAAGVAELVGIATLPSARRCGVAAAVTVALARHALDRGHPTVFLSAQDDDVARVYERVGFRRRATACIGEPPGT